MPTALRNVRFQGQSGKHMLALSSSQFDQPNETSGMIATAEVLILIGENGGDPIFAHITIIRALRPREPRVAKSLCDQTPDGPSGSRQLSAL